MILSSSRLLPQKSLVTELDIFSRFITNNGEKISTQTFSEEFGKIQRTYLKDKKRDIFCLEADKFSDNLVNQNNLDFAGIVMSALCKLTQYILEQLEKFAQKGYEIAKSNNDCLHMMARLNDLRRIYFRNPEKLYNYIQVLLKQEKCLNELTTNYDKTAETFRSITRKPASKKEYERMLAHVQTELGKLIKKRHPHQAQAKLISAREIFEKQGNYQHLDYIDMLLSEIDRIILRKRS